MMMNQILIKSFVLGVVLTLGSFQQVNAMSLKQRTAIIKGLKNKGIVGENNKGFVELRKQNTKFAKVIQEENAYRKKIYQSIAKKQGVSVVKVGQQRAGQIAAQALKGCWLQKADGTWYHK